MDNLTLPMHGAPALAVMAALALALSAAPRPAAAWINDATLRDSTLQQKPTPLPRFSVNLDLPQEERWVHIANQSKYREGAPALVAYLASNVPAWALPIIEIIGADIEPYFGDLGKEMSSISKSLGIKLGDVVALNLVMQLESIGLNCSNWNNTAPTTPNDPGCEAVDPSQKWCYCHDKKARHGGVLRDIVTMASHRRARGEPNGPGLCTSVVAQDPTGQIYHGRNLDWNLPTPVLEFMVDVDYTRAGKTVFTGSTAVGFVGVMNGMVPGQFSTSIDARKKGGKVLLNLLQALLKKSLTPAQLQRKVLETAPTFEAAVDMLSTSPLIDDVYYVVGGAKAGEGVIIARDRDTAADKWKLDAALDPDGWFRLETNYDRKDPVPKADDRRTPGYANMRNLTRARVNAPKPAGIWSVMTAWPTFNHHTDYTGIFSAASSQYESVIWM